MERLALNQQYVRHITVCVCLHWAVLSVDDAIWGRNFTLMRYFAVRWHWRLCVYLCLQNIFWNEYRIRRKPTASTFALLPAYVNLKVLVIRVWLWGRKASCVMSLSRMHHFAGLQWRSRLCVDVCFLNVWNGCRVGRARTARAFVLLRVCAWRVYWRSMQYDEVILATSYAILLLT